MVHIYNGTLLSHNKNGIMPYAATRMDLEIITLSDVNQTKTNIIPYNIKYRSGLSFPPPGDLLDPEIKLGSPAFAGRFVTTEPPGKAQITCM